MGRKCWGPSRQPLGCVVTLGPVVPWKESLPPILAVAGGLRKLWIRQSRICSHAEGASLHETKCEHAGPRRHHPQHPAHGQSVLIHVYNLNESLGEIDLAGTHQSLHDGGP